MERQILVKVWQRKLTPKQALEEIKRVRPKLNPGKEEKILEWLLALSKREITTTEAEEEVGYEQDRAERRSKKDFCQI